MDSVIRALAEAFYPGLPTHDDPASPVLSEYLSTSGADCPEVITQVHNIVDKQLYGPSQSKLKLLLGLMAYRLPTLLLAGRHCLSSSWPFVLSVPEMDVAHRHAMLTSWAQSWLADLRQAYKGIKAILAAVLLSHIDPKTQTNPFFRGMGYVPGNALHDTAVGPPPPGAAEQEELLASATVHLPDVLAAAGSTAAAQAYLTKRGFSTTPQGTGNAVNGGGAHADNNPVLQQSSSTAAGGGLHLYYDAVVVGSGAGGGVTAAVLAAAGLRVLVLEKSSWVRSKDMSWLEHEAFQTMYERAGFMATDDGALVMLAGSTLGGGTKINWTASLKPPPHVRQEWASAPHGLAHLGPDSPAFDAALDAVCSRLGVCTGTARSTPNAKMEEGLRALQGHVEEYPRNCLSKTCSAYCNMGCRSGHKQSSEVWLVDAVRAGAQVLTGVQADKVLMQACQANGSNRNRTKHAVGVQGSFSSSSSSSSSTGQPGSSSVRLVVHAPLVVSSCGSIHTPALLLRSGITGGGAVGTNLRLHPATGLVAQFDRTPEQAAAGKGSVNMYSAGVSMGVFSRAGANWESGGYGPLLSVPACQPGLLAAICADQHLGHLKETMLRLNDSALVVIFTRDSGSGRVSIDSWGRPVATYWPCPTTCQHLLEVCSLESVYRLGGGAVTADVVGIILAVRALAAAGAQRIIVPHAVEPWELQLDPNTPQDTRQQQVEALVQRMRAVGIKKYDMPLFSAHQMGSCRMGSSRSTSACDATGEVWDVAGLYIADGSAFPTPSGVNPMITIFGVSYLTAQGIASRWKQRHRG